MVKKKGADKVDKFFIVFLLIVMASLVFVFAAITLGGVGISPAQGGNYSGTMFLNCTTDMNTSVNHYNATFYYNATGGTTTNSTIANTANSGNLTHTIWNGTPFIDTNLNITIDTTWLADGRAYNISCYADNGTDQEWASVANITIDNTGPAVTFVATNVSNNGNYTPASSVIINVTVSDATIGMYNSTGPDSGTGATGVFIQVTNSTDGQAPTSNWTRASNVTSNHFNVSLNTSLYPDGVYKITVWANDSAYLNLTNATGTLVNVNLNNTESINFTMDNTAPSSVTITNTTSTTKTQIVATITAVDATTGIDNCVVDSSENWAITGEGTGTQTLTHTGLNCGNTYSYIATCYDYLGKGTSSSSTEFATLSCESDGGSSSSGGGSSTTTTWKQTFTVTAEQFKEGYTRTMGVDRRVKIMISNEAHHVGIKEITATSATIEIASDPVSVKLEIGEDAKIDVNEDGYYDVYVQLKGIVNGEADVLVKSISEVVPKNVGEGVETSGEVVGGEDIGTGEEEDGGLTWLWVVLGIILVGIVVWFILNKKK